MSDDRIMLDGLTKAEGGLQCDIWTKSAVLLTTEAQSARHPQ